MTDTMESSSRPRRSASLRSMLTGTAGLATNGGSLILNVLVSGFGGFIFWIVVANNATPTAVSQGTALISAMLGVLMLSQQTISANIPPLIAAAPRPRQLAAKAYGIATLMTAFFTIAYVVFGPVFADGLGFLRDLRLAVIFVVGCLVWSSFALQDAMLAGIRKGQYVLAENTVWTLCRVALVLAIPAIGLTLGVELIVATWLVPATVMVGIVSYYLFWSNNAPLSRPLGNHQFDRKKLFVHLGWEQATSFSAGLTTIGMPAVALTAIGAAAAAPFLAAYQFVVVSESAMGTFTNAFAVEIRRLGRVTPNLLRLTLALMAVFSVAVVGATQLFADDFMALFGSEYRGPGGAALRILALGMPFRCVSMLCSSMNRLYGAGHRSFAQQVGYAGTLFGSLALLTLDSGEAVALCLLLARISASIIAALNLSFYVRKRIPLPSSDVAVAADDG